jgi:two-component system nitrogen regulation sensor histidine kinase NtrY
MRNGWFSVSVIIRVILISLTCLAVIVFYKLTNRPATTLFFLVLLIVQTISLIFYVSRLKRDLANFLVFLYENDTTVGFSKARIERNFKGLIYHLEKINIKLQEARIDRERQYHYLQAIVEQVNTGIIACDERGSIVLLNKAAQELLGIHDIKHITVLIRKYPPLDVFFRPDHRHPSPVKIRKDNGFLLLAVNASQLKFDGTTISLVSFQNIKPELEAGELDAWRKLIRTQRHEIVNSITPINTLTAAIRRRFKTGNRKRNPPEITNEDIDDTLVSVEAIEERSKGLINFMEAYKTLTNIPELKIASFGIRSITDRIAVLFSEALQAKKAGLNVILENEDIMLTADEKLLEQVMINLVKNSLEALDRPGGEIVIRIFRNSGDTLIIQVKDNGTGIEPDILESVFIPSFSTKEQGMGIGLSLCRQIIRLHGGTIRASSVPGSETVMEITLPV